MIRLILHKGVVVHPDEITQTWKKVILGSDIDILGIHPVGGGGSHERVRELAENGFAGEAAETVRELTSRGVGLEYELHVMSLLLPRGLYESHPEYFRLDENGVRSADYNCCASNKDALEIISQNACELAKKLPSSTHRYCFWLDDVRDKCCHCPECSRLSASDQALIVYNAVQRGVRRADILGRQSYLAYCGATELPSSVEPEDGIYLEYAPFDRDFHKPMSCPENASSARNARELAAFFGASDGKVLEYWLDNSMFSGWQKPPKKLNADPELIKRDLEFYEALGFGTVTTFACYLGADYEELWGEPDLGGYAVFGK